MSNLARQNVSAAALAHKWNQRFPIGTAVRYWTGTRDGIGKTSITLTKAEVLGGHTAVVWLDGHAACVSLSHVEPLS
jgi:hypothetical protein